MQLYYAGIINPSDMAGEVSDQLAARRRASCGLVMTTVKPSRAAAISRAAIRPLDSRPVQPRIDGVLALRAAFSYDARVKVAFGRPNFFCTTRDGQDVITTGVSLQLTKQFTSSA